MTRSLSETEMCRTTPVTVTYARQISARPGQSIRRSLPDGPADGGKFGETAVPFFGLLRVQFAPSSGSVVSGMEAQTAHPAVQSSRRLSLRSGFSFRSRPRKAMRSSDEWIIQSHQQSFFSQNLSDF